MIFLLCRRTVNIFKMNTILITTRCSLIKQITGKLFVLSVAYVSALQNQKLLTELPACSDLASTLRRGRAGGHPPLQCGAGGGIGGGRRLPLPRCSLSSAATPLSLAAGASRGRCRHPCSRQREKAGWFSAQLLRTRGER